MSTLASPTFDQAIELFLEDAFALGRLTTARSAAEYRRTIRKHADDAGGLGPTRAGRDEIKRTLRRWDHPNTKRRKRSMLVSFYDWVVEEGWRPDNPARQVRAPRGREPRVRRLTLDEVRAVLRAARGRSERRIVYLAACAGLRCSELRMLKGRHFAREGWIHVSAEMAKGGRERWLPVMGDLRPVVEEIRGTTEPEHYVLPATRWVESERGLAPVERPEAPCDRKTIWRRVKAIGKRAGIGTTVHPHQLRHAFADRVTRMAGPDELADAMAKVSLWPSA